MKQVVRQLLRVFSLFTSFFKFRNNNSIVFLMYHRVTGDTNLELDLRYSDFVKQFKFLVETGKVISLD